MQEGTLNTPITVGHTNFRADANSQMRINVGDINFQHTLIYLVHN